MFNFRVFRKTNGNGPFFHNIVSFLKKIGPFFNKILCFFTLSAQKSRLSGGFSGFLHFAGANIILQEAKSKCRLTFVYVWCRRPVLFIDAKRETPPALFPSCSAQISDRRCNRICSPREATSRIVSTGRDAGTRTSWGSMSQTGEPSGTWRTSPAAG